MTSNVGVISRTSGTAPRRRFGPSARIRRVIGLLALVLIVAGCGTSPGSREDLIEVITQDGAFTVEEATCIADAVFDRYGDDDDALGKISAADSYEFFDEDNGVPGFTAFFDETVVGCAAVGPTSG